MLKRPINTYFIDLVITGVKGYKDAIQKYPNNEALCRAFKYLIGQTVRQYILLPQHMYVSVEAMILWEEITSDDIKLAGYRKQITCDKLVTQKIVKTYKGAQKLNKEITLRAGDKFVFNDIFHEDHVIPVVYFVDELIRLDLEELTEEKVEDILDGMYIAKILKEEDRSLPRTKRPLTFEEVLATTYKSIELQPLVKNDRLRLV